MAEPPGPAAELAGGPGAGYMGGARQVHARPAPGTSEETVTGPPARHRRRRGSGQVASRSPVPAARRTGEPAGPPARLPSSAFVADAAKCARLVAVRGYYPGYCME